MIFLTIKALIVKKLLTTAYEYVYTLLFIKVGRIYEYAWYSN